MELERRRESPMGYHFIHLYQLCPRKFFIKYVLGIAVPHTAVPLVLGGAIHEAIARWYLGDSEKACIKLLEKQIERDSGELEDPDKVDLLLIKAEAMFRNFLVEFGYQDKRDYKILGVELEMKPTLPNGYVTTVRADTVFGLRDGGALLNEIKTTSWSATLTNDALEMSDQVSSYLYALRQCHPEWVIEGCIHTIIYGRQAQIHSHRYDVIYRTERDLKDFELQTMGLMTEITQKIRALNDYPWIMLFPRDTQWCTAYYRKCEYFPICRQELTGTIPPGYVKDEWADLETLLKIGEDSE